MNGVPVGKTLQPATTSLRGLLLEILGRREKRLSAGVGHVEYKFLTQVIGEADQGLLRSNTNVARDAGRETLPTFDDALVVRFKETAWKVFRLVMSDEGCDMGIDLPPEVLQMKPARAGIAPPRDAPSAKPKQEDQPMIPRISSDFRSPPQLG